MSHHATSSTRKRFIDPPAHADSHPPRLTKKPWNGYSIGDWPREKPLPRCPSQRCCRAKQCLDAYDGLYCKREFLSPKAIKTLYQQSQLQQRIKALLPFGQQSDPAIREAWAHEVAGLHKDNVKRLTALWKDGHLDRFYGAYRPGGVVIAPPVKRYQEQ
jgi:hypothetical protein